MCDWPGRGRDRKTKGPRARAARDRVRRVSRHRGRQHRHDLGAARARARNRHAGRARRVDLFALGSAVGDHEPVLGARERSAWAKAADGARTRGLCCVDARLRDRGVDRSRGLAAASDHFHNVLAGARFVWRRRFGLFARDAGLRCGALVARGSHRSDGDARRRVRPRHDHRPGDRAALRAAVRIIRRADVRLRDHGRADADLVHARPAR